VFQPDVNTFIIVVVAVRIIRGLIRFPSLFRFLPDLLTINSERGQSTFPFRSSDGKIKIKQRENDGDAMVIIQQVPTMCYEERGSLFAVDVDSSQTCIIFVCLITTLESASRRGPISRRGVAVEKALVMCI
jgi:hypothetical protein